MKVRSLCFLLVVSLLLGIVSMAPVARAASDLKASDECLGIIKKFEGFSARPYVDSDGKYTIGYGTRCPDELVEKYEETPMTEEEADAELRKEMGTYEKAVNRFIDRHGLSFSQHQFDALISFVFNVGTSWLTKGATLIDALTRDASENEVIYAFCIYSISGGVRSVGHIRRRLCEANVYLNGVYSISVPEELGYVIYDPQGGSVSAMGGGYNVQGYDVGLTAQIVAEAFRPGYTFEGWFTEDGRKVTVLDASTRDLTLYAHWSGRDAEELPQEPETAPTEPEVPETEPEEPPVEGTPIDPVEITVTGDVVNVRSGAGLSYEVTGRKDRGDVITVRAVLEADGHLWGLFPEGWIALENTDYSAQEQPEEPAESPTEPAEPETEPAEPPVEEPQEPEEPELVIPEGIPMDPVEVTITGDVVNVRIGPGLVYEVIGGVLEGEQLTVDATYDGDGYLWGRLAEGWIALDHTNYSMIEDTEESEPAEPETEPTEPEPEPTEPETEPTEPETEPTEPETEPTEPETEPTEPETEPTEPETEPTEPETEPTEPDEGPTELETEPVEPEEEPMEPEEPVTKTYATVLNTNPHSILSEPGGEVVGRLLPGAKVQVYEQITVQEGRWGRCAQGWICMLPNVKLETVEIASGGSEGAVDQSAPPVTKPRVENYATVTDQTGQELFTKPEGKSCGMLEDGQRVQILEFKIVGQALWGRCTDGWVSLRSGMRIETKIHGTPGQEVLTITAACLNLRSEADGGSVVGRLYDGTKVIVRELKTVEGTIWARLDMGWIELKKDM